MNTVKIFSQAGDFEAIRAAEAWCAEQGLSVGRMCGDEPMGLKKGSYDIQKWRNLSAEDRAGLDGTITGDKRNGPVTVSVRLTA